MASYDKLVKYLGDKFQAGLSPLGEIIKNQEIIITQNKQIIDLLTRINIDREMEQGTNVRPSGTADDTEA
ncbi:hypothetical protein SCACP_39980 [Sporomusa carbonis]|uniref:hypothetical protein n=1 Tax=Sporomusa carbonis TaxID=3076075 RepID=UPI003A72BEFD